MDTIQILNIDIPVKAYNIKKSEIQMKEVLLKEARKYLKNCSNYFASGILYPKNMKGYINTMDYDMDGPRDYHTKQKKSERERDTNTI